MKVIDSISELRSAMRASEVFATPYEKNGVTVIPAAKITGGVGGGGGDTQDHSSGSGLGFGLIAHPAGAFVIKGDQVTWQPAIDVNRIILMCQLVGIVALLTLRAARKASANRRS